MRDAVSRDASLEVTGLVHKGWTEVTVTRSMEQLAPTFEVAFAERWSTTTDPIPIRAGDSCVLRLGDEIVCAGYVDDAEINGDAKTHEMRVSGRSKTGDLVDCAAVVKTGQWRKAGLKTIAEDLIRPFGLTVEAKTDLGAPFGGFFIEDGEKVHETIERACRMRGVLMATSQEGNLMIVKVGAEKTATVIEYGVNVLKHGRTESWKERFSEYTVKAQSPGTETFFGKSASQPKASSKDEVVWRYRPTIVHSEGHDTSSGLRKRADWERNVRAARAQRLRYTMHGWTDNAGKLWAPNTLVRVKDEPLEVDTELIIVSVRQTKGGEGTSTDLELCDPRAMTAEPLTPQPKKGAKTPFFVKGSAP